MVTIMQNEVRRKVINILRHGGNLPNGKYKEHYRAIQELAHPIGQFKVIDKEILSHLTVIGFPLNEIFTTPLPLNDQLVKKMWRLFKDDPNRVLFIVWEDKKKKTVRLFSDMIDYYRDINYIHKKIK